MICTVRCGCSCQSPKLFGNTVSSDIVAATGLASGRATMAPMLPASISAPTMSDTRVITALYRSNPSHPHFGGLSAHDSSHYFVLIGVAQPQRPRLDVCGAELRVIAHPVEILVLEAGGKDRGNVVFDSQTPHRSELAGCLR